MHPSFPFVDDHYFWCISVLQYMRIKAIFQLIFVIISILTAMDKPSWRKIEKSNSKPCPRWGHACTVVGEEIVFFGGYADSNYMNDVWTYSASTMRWEEINTTGEKPSHRSNCSLNYDSQSQQLVVFGGGGPNKQRFNTINVLDWKTKVWVEISPKENEPSPWERTYHVAELRFPYLVLFGGEGVSDLDDLWIFNFNTLSWTEVKMDKDATKPCARRFHSSCLIGNQMFIIAGCHAKYRCLSDVYSLDLTPLMETNSAKELKWVERKLKGASFLSRWGHSSVVYDNKIYVFAGRFSNDLNDLLVIDVVNNSLKGLKIGGNAQEHPKPRRRHSAGFVGSCMIAFGGFNGEYFNDLHYINVFQLNNKVEAANSQEIFKNSLGKDQLYDGMLFTSDGEGVKVHSALIARHFKTYADFLNYLEDINHNYDRETLASIIQTLYKSFGKLPSDEIHLKYDLGLPETLNRRHLVNRLAAESEPNERNMLKMAHQLNERSNELIVNLKRNEFERFLEGRRNEWYSDAVIIAGNSEIRVNRTLISLGSGYFYNIFSGRFQEGEEVRLSLAKPYTIVLDIFLNYLMMGVVVVPVDFTCQAWMELTELSQYFCVDSLKALCEGQLCTRILLENVEDLQSFSEYMSLCNLSLHCANFQLKHSLKANELKKKVSGMSQCSTKRQSSFIRLYQTLKFDLYHSSPLQKEKQKEPGLKKHLSEGDTHQEKENREYNNA